MTIIHMETEATRQLASRLEEKANQLLDFGDALAANCYKMDWQGKSRDEFLDNTLTVKKQLSELGELLDALASRLRQEIAQWELADAQFADGQSLGAMWLNQNHLQFVDHVWLTHENISKLANTFALFTTSSEGRDLIAQAYAAGLFFVIIENGQEVGWLGDPNGKRIPINWNELEGAYGQYIPTPGNEQIEMNTNHADGMHVYWNTLAHEMQHAIDFNTDALDMQAISKMNDLFTTTPAETVQTMPVNDIEAILEQGLTEYVKSEVNAHDRGHRIDPTKNYFEDRLDASDGIYTREEFNYVINTRGYEKNYEQHINTWLQEVYGPDTAYRADVWVDMQGNLRVDIDQTRPLISRIIETVF